MGDIVVDISSEDRYLVDAFVGRIKLAKPNVRRTQLSEADRDCFERAGKLGEVVFARHFGHDVDWSVHAGGDHCDFLLNDGTSVDVKSVYVQKNMSHDFSIPIGEGESPATFFVQVLIAPEWDRGVITGGISRQRFMSHASTEDGWSHRGSVRPFVVKRSQLSQEYPASFWGTK